MIVIASLIAQADPRPVLSAGAADHSGVVLITQGDAAAAGFVQHVASYGRTAPGNPEPPSPETLL